MLGLLLATKAAVSQFGPDGGSIINIGSVASRQTPAGASIYTATKGAVDAITRVLSKELGPRKIRVNSINPGGVETPGTHAANLIGNDFEAAMIGQAPLGRFGQPLALIPTEGAPWMWRVMGDHHQRAAHFLHRGDGILQSDAWWRIVPSDLDGALASVRIGASSTSASPMEITSRLLGIFSLRASRARVRSVKNCALCARSLIIPRMAKRNRQ